MRIQVCYAFFLVENAQVLWPQPMFVCCCYTPGNSWNITTKSFGPSLWCFSDGLPGGKDDVGKGRYFGIKWPADARNVYACICKYLCIQTFFGSNLFIWHVKFACVLNFAQYRWEQKRLGCCHSYSRSQLWSFRKFVHVATLGLRNSICKSSRPLEHFWYV